jgi:abhydrolase domain-containing protein 14
LTAIAPLNIPYRAGALHGLAAGAADGSPVLLLHGQAFNSGTWKELGTLVLLADNGARALAIDLPGFGQSSAVKADPDTFLAEIMPVLGLDRPIVVAPSMSGRFLFPFMIGHPDRLAGVVLVAPVGIERFGQSLRNLDLPALIVWGDQDRVMPVAGANRLAACLAGSRTLILRGARHPCYLDRPAEFHAALLEFIGVVRCG